MEEIGGGGIAGDRGTRGAEVSIASRREGGASCRLRKRDWELVDEKSLSIMKIEAQNGEDNGRVTSIN